MRWRAFTLIEVLVTTMLVAIAVVGVLTAIRAIAFTNAKAQDADLLQRLASDKMQELRVLPDPAAAASSGTFAAQGHGEIAWTVKVSSTATGGVEQVTVSTTLGPEAQSLSTLMFVPESEGGS